MIDKDQLSAKVLCSGPSEFPFSFTFDNLNKNGERIYSDLIETLIQISSKIPNGILMVFSSFRMQSEFQYQLSRSPAKARLAKVKDIIF